jgi:hypothetical protein
VSWYNTVVVSFSSDEFDGDEPPLDFGPLRKINAWLKRRKFRPLSDLNRGKLGSNAILFGGCFDYLDVNQFCVCVGRQKWRHIEDVQILFWDDNASKFSVIEFPL